MMGEWIRKEDAIEAASWAAWNQDGSVEKWRVDLIQELIGGVPGVSDELLSKMQRGEYPDE